MNSEEIWNKYSLKLKHYIMKNVSNQFDAEDILQELGIRIKKNENKINNITNIEAWLFKITKNLISDYYRSKNNCSYIEDLNKINISTNTEQDNYNIETANCLLKLVEYLPSTYKDAIIESDYRGEKQTILGQKWGISYSGSKNRVQRARKKLRANFLDCCEIKFDNSGNVTEFYNKSINENKFPCIKC